MNKTSVGRVDVRSKNRPMEKPPRSSNSKRAPKRRRLKRSDSTGSIIYVSTYPSECLREGVSVVDLTKSDESLHEHPKAQKTIHFWAGRFPKDFASQVSLPRTRQDCGGIVRSRSYPLLEKSVRPDSPSETCLKCCAWTDPGEVSWGSHGEEEEEDSAA